MKARDVLQKFDNNVSAMARALDVSRQTIYNWIDQGSLPKLRQMQVDVYFSDK